jgi:hypothetical protein
MRRKQKSDTKNHSPRKIDAPPLAAFSIPEFCLAYRISEMTYYRMQRRGEGPRAMKVGTRTLISIESARDWRIAREAAGAEATEGAA